MQTRVWRPSERAMQFRDLVLSLPEIVKYSVGSAPATRVYNTCRFTSGKQRRFIVATFQRFPPSPLLPPPLKDDSKLRASNGFSTLYTRTNRVKRGETRYTIHFAPNKVA